MEELEELVRFYLQRVFAYQHMQSNPVPSELCSVELRRYDIAASGIIYKNFPLIRELVFWRGTCSIEIQHSQKGGMLAALKLAHVHPTSPVLCCLWFWLRGETVFSSRVVPLARKFLLGFLGILVGSSA